jgi:hypothetical protein
VSVIVNLQTDTLQVEPGHTVTGEMSLTNTGSIVEQFTIMLLGDAAEWTNSDPPVVSLFPGAHQTVTLRFSPPRVYTTPSGDVPFGVKVIPSNEPEESVTEEGTITVGSFSDVGAELVPRQATARITGHQKLAVDSRGNVPLLVAFSAVDAADALKVGFSRSKVTTVPGEARFIRMRIKPRQRFWRGPPQFKPYQVQVAPDGEQPLVLEGALSQKAVLPKWLLPLLGALAAVALLWFLVLRPIVHNDAVNASKAAIQQQAKETKALQTQVNKANQSAQEANNSAQQANSAALQAQALAKKNPVVNSKSPTVIVNTPKPTVATTTTSTTIKPPPTTLGPVTGPNDGEVDVVAAPGQQPPPTGGPAPIPAHSKLQVTDIVIQNLGDGSSGIAQVERLVPNSKPQVLLVENLATLTDEEFRFTTPIVFTPGQRIALQVQCAPGQGACEVHLYYTGPETVPPNMTTTTGA